MNTTLDIQLQNFQNARVLNSNGSIFLLNGIDLFIVNVDDKSEKPNNLKKIGSLAGVENQTISDIKVSAVIQLHQTRFLKFISSLVRHHLGGITQYLWQI